MEQMRTITDHAPELEAQVLDGTDILRDEEKRENSA